VGHYPHSVKALLAVEQDNVPIPEMPLHHKASLHSLRHHLPVCNELWTNPSPIRTHDVQRPWVVVRTVVDETLHLVHLVRGNLLGNCEPARNIERDPDLVDVQIGIWRNDCPS